MKSITPEVGAPLMRVAEDQPEFVPITVALVRHWQHGVVDYPPDVMRQGKYNSVLMAFRPSDEERARIAAGEDIYVSLLTFGGAQQGIVVLAGKEEASAVFNVALRTDEPFESPLPQPVCTDG